MKNSENLKLVGISLLLIAGLSACDKPGPAERAGSKIDQAAEDVGRRTSAAADSAGEKMSEQTRKAGGAIEDTAITTKVKAAILAEPNLKTLQISVDTVQGVVTLSGAVDSQSSISRAKSVASGIDGVKEVRNQLVVK
ncbi:MAG: BON domain-containing protein [Gallionella sp.]